MPPQPIRRTLSIVAITCSLGLIPPSAAFAGTRDLVTDPSGKPMFELTYYDNGESMTFEDEIMTSSWTLSAPYREELHRAAAYWADVLGPYSANSRPVSISVVADDEANAAAASITVEDDTTGTTRLPITEQLVHDREWQGGTGFILFGQLLWEVGSHPDNITHNGDRFATFPTITHEIAHALGLLSRIESENGSANFETLNRFEQSLVDKYGIQAQAGMAINGEEHQIEGTFHLVNKRETDSTSLSDARGHAYFMGKNALEVIGNAKLGYDGINGIPINGWEKDDDDPDQWQVDMSHVELDNVLMSHQDWRNYTTFTEAEIAIIQDLGYTIDRKRHFGHSIYGSHLTWESDHGYSARNADGTGWLENTYNDTAYGMGLHIYGDGNTVTQKHDILSSGVAAMGIRIDGQGNAVTVAPDTRVHALGDWAAAMAVAYGKDHHIIHRGDLAATGAGGIAIQIDFGDNLFGNDSEYRGSYMHTIGRPDPDIDPDDDLAHYKLDGALVDTLDITGHVTGSAAAIKIAENAYVETINIMQGAQITGDIVSDWNPANDKLDSQFQNQLYTRLNFGLTPKDDGTAGDVADPGFRLDYSGNILGAKSLDLTLHGGALTLSGMAETHTFTNDGDLSLTRAPDPEKAAITTGTYTQNSGATLETAFNASGQTSGITATDATIDGHWRLRASADFYRTGTSVTIDDPIHANTETGQFRNVSLGNASSPTLLFTLTGTDPAAPTVTASREDDAYSRYADNAGAASVGLALPAIAKQASGDMETLFAGLDFSAMNGSDIRDGLKQLAPGAYDSVVRESLDNQHELNMQSVNRLLEASFCTDPAKPASCRNDWTVSVHPFGKYSHLPDRGHKAGYTSSGGGLTVSAEKTGDDGLTLAFDASLSERRTPHTAAHPPKPA